MHHFKYRNNKLYCESVNILDIAKKVETPFYLYSYKTLIDHYRKIKNAFLGIRPLICFSMKSNSNLSVCRALVREGSGLDIVSGGELFKAQKADAPAEKIVYASVGKTTREIDSAIKRGILFFNVESVPELVVIEKLCVRLGKRTRVCIRVNPAVEAHTHRYITTGTQQDKFGIDFDTVIKIFDEKDRFPHLDIIGLHIHIGSQITESAPFIKAIRKVSGLIKILRQKGHTVSCLNIGGGLGIIYHKERPQTANQFAKAVLPLLRSLDVKVILEPGRFIAGNSGILITRVLYVKDTPTTNFIIVDAGMSDLIRPSLYEAYHEIIPVARCPSRLVTKRFDVVGPICESGDFMARDRKMPEPKEGEFLAIMGVGAYGFSMSSNYNARPRCAEVMVIKGRYYITRKRETYEDLIRGETIPKVLM